MFAMKEWYYASAHKAHRTWDVKFVSCAKVLWCMIWRVHGLRNKHES